MKKFVLLFSFSFVAFFGSAQDRKENINIYPNPVTNFFELNNAETAKEVRVINLAGRQVRTFGVTNGERYDVADLPTGMYLLQIVGKNNRILTTHRVSKRN